MGLLALILGVPVAAIGLYVFVVEPLWVLPALEWMTSQILYRVKTEKPLVGLSFDDGPHPGFTPRVLEILERFDAKATFFVIGERAERHPELVLRIRTEGHEIGNHYWRDGTTLGHSRAKFVEKLEATERAIYSAMGNLGPSRKTAPTTSARPDLPSSPTRSGQAKSESGPPTEPGRKNSFLRFFRAPGGVAWPWQLRRAREHGYTSVLGCAYPHDPMQPPVKYICWLIEKNLRPGTIVILHDGIKDAMRSIEALPHILAEGKRRGFRFVSVGELFEEPRSGSQAQK